MSNLVEHIEGQPGAGVARWKLCCDAPVTSHDVSRDGRRTLVGTEAGDVYLFAQDGTEIWRFELREPISTVSCGGAGETFVAGTWGGRMALFVEEGFERQVDMDGVVSALAMTDDGEQVTAGTWAGRFHSCYGRGDPLGSANFTEAVTHIAMDRSGDLVLAGLADNRVVALTPEGEVRWSHDCGAPVVHLDAWRHEAFVATAAGVLRWIDAEGTVRQEGRTHGSPTHLAASLDGSSFTSVDEAGRLTMWERDHPRWDEPLPSKPDSIRLLGHGEFAMCLVALPTPEIMAFNWRRRQLRLPLPARAASLCFSGSGIDASCATPDGTFYSLELGALREWLSPPQLTFTLRASVLVEGELGTLTIDLVNDGGREALGLAISIGGNFLKQTHEHTVERLAPGQHAELKRAIELTHTGNVPLDIRVDYQDGLGEQYSTQRQEFVRVASSRDRRQSDG